MTTSRHRRNVPGSGARYPQEKSGPSGGLLAALAVFGIAATALVTTLVVKNNPGETAVAAPSPAEDAFAQVARAGPDLGGDDVATMTEKVGEDAFTLAWPKSFVLRVQPSLAGGKCLSFSEAREKSSVVWVVGASRDAVAADELVRIAGLDPSGRTDRKPLSQRLGSVVGAGERFSIPQDPEPLECIFLRAGFGLDREVVVFGVAPERSAKLRSVIDAMLGSLRADKLQGVRAVGGLTFLPRRELGSR